MDFPFLLSMANMVTFFKPKVTASSVAAVASMPPRPTPPPHPRTQVAELDDEEEVRWYVRANTLPPTLIPIPKNNPSSQERRRRNACRIKCPVLGIMCTCTCTHNYTHPNNPGPALTPDASVDRCGLLNPDEEGRVSWQHLYGALRGIGTQKANALFQSIGISAFAEDDPHQKWRMRGGAKRFINIYRLNNCDDIAHPEMVNHGFGTAIRDTCLDMADNGVHAVGLTYP